jgi:hypothetical protein
MMLVLATCHLNCTEHAGKTHEAADTKLGKKELVDHVPHFGMFFAYGVVMHIRNDLAPNKSDVVAPLLLVR